MTDQDLIATVPADDGRGRSRRVRFALGAILLILILLLASLAYFIVGIIRPASGPAGDAEKAGLEWVRSIYAYGPGPDESLDSPVAVAISPNGTIWVGDTQRDAVIAFRPDGSVQRVIYLPPLLEGIEHVSPKAIAWFDGELYVGAHGAHKILVLSEQGELLRSWDIPNRVFEIHCIDGQVLVSADAGIGVFTPQGELIGGWVPDGSSLDQVHLAQGIDGRDGQDVFVADTMNGRVKAFSQEGDLVWATEQGRTTAPGQMGASSESTSVSGFQTPLGLALDGRDRVVAADMLAMELFVLDPADGQVVATYGKYGVKDGEFLYPSALAYDPGRDWFAIADTGNSRIQIFRLPDSGNDNIVSAARRSLVGPAWICGIPFFLVLLLVLLALRRRRPARSGTQSAAVDA